MSKYAKLCACYLPPSLFPFLPIFLSFFFYVIKLSWFIQDEYNVWESQKCFFTLG